jgi:hypothetical protein
MSDSLLFNIYEIAYAVNTMGGHQRNEPKVESKKSDNKWEGLPWLKQGQKYLSATSLTNCWPFISDLQYLP